VASNNRQALNPANPGNLSARGGGGDKAGGLKVRQHPVNGPYVEGLMPCAVQDYREVEVLMDRGTQAGTALYTPHTPQIPPNSPLIHPSYTPHTALTHP